MPNNFTFKISGVAEATGEMLKAIQLGEIRGMEKIGLRGEALVKDRTPVGATANLISGVFSELSQKGPQLSELISVHGPAAKYAAPVELGANPHMPPVEALVLWVQKKLHVSNEKQALSLAWAIAKTIKKRGIKGEHMFDVAFDQLKNEAPGILEREIAEALQAAGFGGKQ
jgi:hypothetical protein